MSIEKFCYEWKCIICEKIENEHIRDYRDCIGICCDSE